MSTKPEPGPTVRRIAPYCWFPRDAYEQAKAMMADPDRLYDSYDTWLREAKKFEAEMAENNIVTKRVRFHREAFGLFCTTRNLVPDGAARAMWASFEAQKAGEVGRGG